MAGLRKLPDAALQDKEEEILEELDGNYTIKEKKDDPVIHCVCDMETEDDVQAEYEWQGSFSVEEVVQEVKQNKTSKESETS